MALLPRSLLPPCRTSAHSRLRAGEAADNDGDKPRRRWRNPQATKKLVTKLVKSLIAYQSRTAARFQKLSRKAKRLVLLQLVVVGCLCGGAARNVHQRGGASPPPIEIAYSSFLDLVAQQPAASTQISSSSNNNKASGEGAQASAVVLDQLRIGTDRMTYRLHRPAALEPTKTTPPPLATPTKRSLLSRRRTKKPTPPAVWRAYTRQVPASPALVETLRTNQITFSALAQPRQSALAVTARTLIVGFYCLILWRLYGTISKAGGGGNSDKDVPGKLAQTSDLPMATFDEIQGIDNAKLEVMELVDTLRNPVRAHTHTGHAKSSLAQVCDSPTPPSCLLY
jgi:hypothetical protein